MHENLQNVPTKFSMTEHISIASATFQVTALVKKEVLKCALSKLNMSFYT
jgi:hypothetical protein